MIQLELPQGANDLGVLFGPTMKLSDGFINEEAIVFGIGMHKIATRYRGDWEMQDIVEGFVGAKVRWDANSDFRRRLCTRRPKSLFHNYVFSDSFFWDTGDGATN